MSLSSFAPVFILTCDDVLVQLNPLIFFRIQNIVNTLNTLILHTMIICPSIHPLIHSSKQSFICTINCLLPLHQRYICLCYVQKQDVGEELQIGLSQQKPLPSSPPPRRNLRSNLILGSRPSMESAQPSEDPSPTLHHSESPLRDPKQSRHADSEEDSRPSSDSPRPDSEVAGPESDPMEGVSQAEVLTVPTLDSHQSYGSRLALSLGDLDIPQLLAERDLHQGDLGMSPSIKSEPETFGGVLSNSLMLNNIGGIANVPLKAVTAGNDPNLMHNLAYWSDRAKQSSDDMTPQGQSHQGHMHAGCHQEPLDSQPVASSSSPMVEVAPGEFFRVPPGGYLIPNPGGSLGHGNPRITSGATLLPACFHDGGGPTVGGLYNGHDGATTGKNHAHPCCMWPLYVAPLVLNAACRTSAEDVCAVNSVVLYCHSKACCHC